MQPHLEAAKYYATNFEKIVRVLYKLHNDEAVSINISRDLLRCRVMKSKLTFFVSNYGFFGESITKLETSGLPLAVQINVAEDATVTVNGEAGNFDIYTTGGSSMDNCTLKKNGCYLL